MYFLLTAGMGWFIAQTIKVVLETIVERKLVWKRFFGDGGYPSCHAAFVTAGFVAVSTKYNWSKTLEPSTEGMILAVFGVLWFITIRDALGYRLQQGQTAKNVNKIVDFLHKNIDRSVDNVLDVFNLQPLKLQGHFPHEVFAGIVTGGITGYTTVTVFDSGRAIIAIIVAIGCLILVALVGLIISLLKIGKAEKIQKIINKKRKG